MASTLQRDIYVRYLANELDRAICDAYVNQRLHSDEEGIEHNPIFFSETIQWFKRQKLRDNPQEVTFQEVLNCPTYERFHGTFAHVIVKLVFYPFHFIWDTVIIEQMSDQYKNHLSKHELHNILSETFRLVNEDGMDVSLRDDCNMTPARHIFSPQYLDMLSHMPDNLRGFLRLFKIMFKDGKGLVNKQQGFVRAWLKRKQQEKRKRKAVELIEAWWFEMINSPYTACGERMMMQRAVRWKAAR